MRLEYTRLRSIRHLLQSPAIVIALLLPMAVGCLVHHRAPTPLNSGASHTVGSTIAQGDLHWQPGIGAALDPPSDCVNADPAPKGSLSPGATKGTVPPMNRKKVGKSDEETFDITGRDLSTFQGDVTFTIFPKGYVLYRVIGKGQTSNGAFWTDYLPPTTQNDWRARLAVLAEWNGASCLVKFRVSTEVRTWVGKAAPEPDGAPGWYLMGGGNQIFVPSSKTQIPMQDLQYSSIPWRQ